MAYLAYCVVILALCSQVYGVAFSSTTMQFSTTEELPINTLVGNITGITDGSSVKYTILGGDIYDLFTLVEFDSYVEIKNRLIIDYETLGSVIPPSGTGAIFELTIQANDSNGSDSIYVEITVVNDNYAEVKTPLWTIIVTEKFKSGEVLHTVDTKVPYLLLDYSFASENMTTGVADKFNINRFTGSIQLNSAAKWDYEAETEVILYIKIKPITDGLYNEDSYQKVLVEILDVNDNSNSFTQSSYTFSVNESATTGTVVGTVQADDADKSTVYNNTVYFVLNNMYSNLFSVNNITGIITVVGSLDYETSTSYQLTICATDEATDTHQTIPTNEARIGCAPVTINLNNIDDNTPQITPATKIIVISEKFTGNASIHQFSATDGDGSTPKVKYNTTQTSAATMSIFIVDTNGMVTVNSTNLIDYESTQVYDLYVYAEDANSAVIISDNVHLRVVVLDVNDNSPTFESNSYEFSVAEGSDIGTVVGFVKAYDNDSSNANNNITYSFVVPTSEFAINTITGEITVAGALDREAKSDYYINILATDDVSDSNEVTPGQEARTGATMVKIIITDVNDNDPTFSSNNYAITVSEKVPIGRNLFQFMATDADTGVNSQLTYKVQSMTSSLFYLDPTTGVLNVTAALNYETATSHSVIVYAEDQGSVSKKSVNVTLTINVVDVNDLNPVYPLEVFTKNVPEGQHGYLDAITAVDSDGSSPNNNIVYSLVDPTSSNVITYSPTDGNITIVANGGTATLDRETVSHYEFLLIATDQSADGTERRQATAILILNVVDVNDNVPVFKDPLNNTLTITEATLVGTSIFQFTATDADKMPNVTYHPVNPGDSVWNTFVLNTTTGAVTTFVLFDYSIQSSYVLEVKAMDEGNLVSTQNAMLTVNLADYVGLTFTLDTYTVNIRENLTVPLIPNPAFLGLPTGLTVSAIPDTNTPSTIKYTIKNDAQNIFNINEKGEIFIKNKLDFEQQRYYTFNVGAHDTTNQHYNTTTAVVVNIIDIIDVTPRLDLLYAQPINEESDVGQIVAILRATDIDTETVLIGGLSYEMSPGTGLPFSILRSPDQVTAYIVLSQRLDREIQSSYVFNVTVIDALEYKSNTLEVNITVLDANDNNPNFTQPNGYVFTVPESNLPVTNVSQVLATDPDSTTIYNTIRYSIMGGLEDADIRIDAITGLISINNTIDYESTKRFEFSVVATDTATPGSYQRKSCVPVRIDIQDVNDNNPIFISADGFTVKECAALSSKVFTVSATDADSGAFGMVNFTSSITTPFMVQPNGEIMLNGALDYESQQTITMEIAAMDGGGLITMQNITINITNCNDNRPIFTMPGYAASVSEAELIGTSILTVSAMDGDRDTYNQITYEIINPFDNTAVASVFPFLINSTTGEISSSYTLDREGNDLYQFIVKASDDGNPSLTSVVYVNITVTDVNDNNPVFSKSCYNVSISEGTDVGGTVLIVTATDKDIGMNAQLVYSLDDSSGDFQINNMTGEISVAKDLLYLRQSTYTLGLVVTDQGNPQLNGTSKVIVKIMQRNYPTTVVDIFIDESAAVISTNLTIPPVLILQDPRPGRIYEIEFFNTTTDSEPYFSMDSTTGEVSFIGNLDYDKMRWHVFLRKVSVSVGGDVLGEQTVFVHVRDVNDNPPYFMPFSMNQNVNISESSEVGQIVAVYAVNDVDTTPTSLSLSTSFSPDKIGAAIHNDTIVLYIKTNFDAEIEQEIFGTVTVSDGVHSASQNLTIKVIDENDNSPVFYPMEYIFQKSEDALTGSFIGTVFANDSDVTTANNEIRYRILESYLADVFEINPVNGRITCKAAIDHEVNKMINFTIEAYNDDNNDDNRVGTALITIQVLDVNDNTPDCGGPVRLNITESTEIGTTLFYIEATDKDSDDNGRLTYALASPSNNINVDPVTGAVRLILPLDYEVIKGTIFSFQVSDNGTPPQTCNKAYIVNILDANDNAPSFGIRPDKKYTATISENSGIGTSVEQTFATDGDSGNNAVLNYAIVASYGNLPFNISETGLILTSGNLDREQRDFYQFFISATDNGTPELSDTILVEVTVIDENDNAPVFNQLSYNITLPEGTPIGFSILQLSASDADAGTSGEVKYIISSQTVSNGLFMLDNKTGVLSTTNAITLDKYQTLDYTIEAVANDCDNTNMRYSEQNVTINIKIVPYTSPMPIFPQEYLTFSISENTGVNSKIGETFAFGPDISYHIVYDDSERPEARNFIAIGSGAIYLLKSFDYEQVKSFSFDIRATNKFGVNSTQNIFIKVTDVDDNPPVWSMPQTNQSITIAEESRIGQIVATVSATDIDTVSHNRLQFELKDNFTDTFAVITSQDVGLIVVNKDLKDSLQKDFVLCLEVTDSIGNKANVSAFVEVAVRPNAGELPVFTPTSYIMSIPENSPMFVVGRVSASTVPNMEFYILSDTGAAYTNGIFTIDHSTGIITSVPGLDREQREHYDITVLAGTKNTTRLAEANVHINVLDSNDNSPVFSSPTAYNLTEIYPTNSLLLQLKATDIDATTNSEIEYSFVSSTSPITLQVDSVTGYVTYTSGINFEVSDFYVLTFQAQDKGTPQRRSTTHTVRINVIGVNEFNPVMTNPVYNGVLFENQQIFQTSVSVQATDDDRGDAGRLTYSLAPTSFLHPFQIDPVTGVISVSAPGVDREAKDRYELVAIATDNGLVPRSAAAVVNIQILDLNDNAPVLNPPIYRLTISDATPINSELCGVFATDTDISPNDVIIYEITGGNELGMFRINTTTGVISLNSQIDYSNVAQRNFVLRVVAKNGITKTSLVPATVYINVVQSFIPIPPYFQQDLLVFSFPEDQSLGELAVNAAINPTGGPLQFEVVNNTQVNDEDSFAVAKSNGNLYLIKELDYETRQTHNFLVKATCSTTGLFALQSITINVYDVDDNTPYFLTPLAKTVTINERTSPGQEITSIRATDADFMNRNDLFFRINTPNVPFSITSNGDTGVVYVSSELDATIKSIYALEVTVFDKQQNGALKNEALQKYFLTINIEKNNDNTPVFETPSYTISLKENNVAPYSLGILQATFTNKYSLVGTTNTDFILTPDTGTLFAMRTFDAEVDTEFQFLAIALNAANNNTGYANIRIIITDINDVVPLFYSPYSYDFMENKPSGSYLFNIRINDTDVVETPKQYEILSVTPNIGMTISTTGAIYLTGQFDYETATRHQIVVKVTDKGIPELTNQQTYSINVVNANDNNPVFDGNVQSITINEDDQPNQLFSLQATDGDAGVFGTLTYSLVTVVPMPFFVTETGNFYLTGALDYEDVKTYNLLIKATDGGQPPRIGLKKVRVVVDDINDNIPVFDVSTYNVTVAEGAPIGTSLITVRAIDTDSQKFAIVNYKLVGSSNVFQIDSVTGVISTIGPLDRETNNYYEFQIAAEDKIKPNPSTSNKATVRITVTDVNENQPTFASPYQRITLSESTSIGSSIGVATALDTDATFRTIIYGLAPNEDSVAFAVNPNTGDLTLNQGLDFELKQSYVFDVVATDNGGFKGYQTIEVLVTDVNDNRPVFVNRINQTFVVIQDVKQTIGLLTGADADSVSKGQLQMSIVNDANQQFDIETVGIVGYITAKAGVALDIKTYVAEVLLSDGQLTSAQNAFVTITVKPPLFAEIKFLQQPGYTFSVYENRTSFIFDPPISAKINNNISPITYRIYETENIPFAINQNTGVLRLSGVQNYAISNANPDDNLDFEKKKFYLFHVVADVLIGGIPYGTVTSVMVNVLDTNDNEPEFVGENLVEVQESIFVGSEIMTIVAKDDDSGESGRLTYSISPGSVGADMFLLQQSTGVLSVAKAFDFEAVATYPLLIVVSDNGNPRLSTSKTYTVNILDANDQRPYFNETSITASIREDTNEQNQIICVSAKDNDQSNTGFKYELLSAENVDSQFFVITLTSGCVYYKGGDLLDRETKAKYQYTIVATDSGTPPLSGYTNLVIDILDVNDNAPLFSSSDFNLEIADKTMAGRPIIHLTATDPDAGTNGEVLLSIISGNDGAVFTLDSNNNLLTAVIIKDRSPPKTQYQLTIKAEDNAPVGIRRSSTVNINIAIIDTVNAIVPNFVQNMYNATIQESQTINEPILTVQASVLGDSVSYQILDTSIKTAGKFAVDSNGVVVLVQRLDYEELQAANFLVKAYPTLKPDNEFATTFVNIKITDINDNRPQFDRILFKTSLSRDSKPGTIISTVKATDADSGDNGSIRYKLEPNSLYTDIFEVNSVTGDLTLKRTLQFTDIRNYKIKIMANDLASVSLDSTTSAEVQVNVYPDNMHKPSFVNVQAMTATINENAQVGSTVFTVTAIDLDSNLPNTAIAERPDAENFGKVSYSILPTNQILPFTMNAQGQVTLIQNVDREVTASYEFYVQASDGGSPQRTIANRATVTITDINEPPAFNPSTYSVTVSEASPTQVSILQVSAVDNDIGLNGQLQYAFVEGNNAGRFYIDPINGKITLIDFLDFNQVSKYTLKVRATDSATPALFADAEVAVSVADAYNSTTPVFTLSKYEFSDVLENSGIINLGQVVAKRYGVFGGVSYSIEPVLDSQSFAIQQNGDLRFNGGDFEIKTVYDGVIRAYNSAKPKFYATTNVRVTLKDVNDNYPIIYNRQNNVNIDEDSEVGQIVSVLYGEDQDSTTNGQIIYSFIQPSNTFSIESVNNTGVIKLSAAIDYEILPTYSLQVSAQDQGPQKFRSLQPAFVNVKVTDVNDNNPLPSNNLLTDTVNVQRTQALDTVIYSTVFTDRDSGSNGEVEYVLVASSSNNSPFTVNINGDVVLSSPIPDDNEYVLYMSVRDKGTPTRQTPFTLKIFVEIISTDRPIFSPKSYHIQVKESTLVHSIIARLNVIQPDGVDNALTYAIEQGNVGSAFQIKNNGDIVVIKDLDRDVLSQYTMSVSVTGGGLKASENAVVKITVQDVNDNNPQFALNEYKINLSEAYPVGNSLVGPFVTTIAAIDRDAGTNAALDYVLIDSTETFGINSGGQVWLKKSLDYAANEQYKMLVIARDQGAERRQSSVDFIVNINDVNERPVFSPDNYTLSISEAITVGSSILKINVVDNDSPPNNNKVALFIKNGGVPFTLEGNVLKVNAKLDSEVVSQYQLKISASDSGNPRLAALVDATVTIEILSVNDNQPQFLSSSYTGFVNEGLITPGTIITVSAVDSDSTGNIVYSLDANGDSSFFTITTNNGQGLIALNRPLDYESKRIYSFTVSASDSDNPTFTTKALVVVYANDINDNVPVFKSNAYNFQIHDASPIDSIVGTVSAIDADSTTNAVTEYYLVTGFPDSQNFFLQNNLLLLKSNLDYTQKNTYTFKIGTRDQQSSQTGTPADVTVTVKPSQGNPPVFENSIYNVTAYDNVTVLDAIVKVTAIDSDGGDHGNFVYTLTPSIDSPRFRINPSNGEISLQLGQSLSYQQKRRLILYVRAIDNFGLSANAYVVIHVAGNIIDATRPTFHDLKYSAVASDRMEIGQSLVTVYAVDTQSPSLVYSIISGNNDNMFILSPNGNLQLNKKVVFSSSAPIRYNLFVQATDLSGLTTNPNAEIVIDIVYVNPYVPVFERTEYLENVPENSALGVIFTARATIATLADQTNVRYSMQYNSEVKPNDFIIEPLSGEVFSVRAFDREAKDTYTFEIISYNLKQSSIRDKALVVITITDINDNSPSFLIGDGTQIVILDDNSPPNTRVIDAAAVDADFGTNANIQYSILQSYGGLFVVGGNGKVTTTAIVDHKTQSNYVLNVVAQDQGSPSRSSTLVVSVTIGNKNGARPTFTSTNYTKVIVESNGNILSVLQVIATDIDALDTVSYKLVSIEPNLPFEIGSSTGVISSNAPVDYEKRQSYQFCIEATDSGTPALSATTSVLIIVADSNDNSPIAEQTSYNVEVSEFAAIGTIVTTVRVNDVDSGRNGEVLYRIASGNDGLAFKINNEGEISVKNQLDYDQGRKSYALVITATDDGLNQRNMQTPITVTIQISNENDNSPTISPSEIFKTVDEGSNELVIVDQLQSTVNDLDGDALTFSILDEKDVFTINPTSGEIKTKVALDYDVCSRYVITVMVNDGSRSTYALVTVSVQNINTKPVIVGSPYQFNVVENSKIDTIVGRVIASDQDEGLEGQLVYSMSSDIQNIFTISSDGTIKTAKIIDYEVDANSYNFLVTVQDRGTPPKSSVASVSISVQNINDNSPTFGQPTYSVTANANRDVSMTLSATDIDTNISLLYSLLQSEDSSYFNINSTTGMLTNKQQLSGVRASYDFMVQVSDGERTAIARVIVSVNIDGGTGESCGSIQFSSNLYNVSIPENSKQQVIQVTATMTEQTGNLGIIKYSIQDENSLFMVDQGGVVSTKTTLDFEKKKVEEFCLVAQSSLNPNVKSVAMVRVHIVDVDDVAPIFTKQQPNITIYEQTNIGIIIGSVSATTPGNKFMVTYTTTSTDFVINQITGFISVAKALDARVRSAYMLQVQAATSNSLSTQQNVYITVIASNKSPVFTPSVYSANVDENRAAGTTVAKVTATDADNDALTYRILDVHADKFFSIDASGEIKTKTLLDYEVQSTYRFCVEAKDGSDSDARIAVATVTVSVGNQEDSSPIFKHVNFTVTIPTSWPLDVPIISVQVDNAATVSGVKYNIDPYKDHDFFKIDVNTSDISLTKRPTAGSLDKIVRVRATNDFGSNTTLAIFKFITETFMSQPIQLSSPAINDTTVEMKINQNDFFGNDWKNIEDYDIIVYPVPTDGSEVKPQALCTPEESEKTGCPYLALSGKNTPQTTTRKRRSVTSGPNGDLNLILGTGSGCSQNKNPNVPCNAPLQPGQAYRIQLRGKTADQTIEYSQYTTPVKTSVPVIESEYTVNTLIDRAALNYYYIVGLVVLAVLLVVAVAAIAVLLCYKTMGGIEMKGSYHDRPDAGMQKGSMVRSGGPGQVHQQPAKHYANPGFGHDDGNTEYSSSEHGYGMGPGNSAPYMQERSGHSAQGYNNIPSPQTPPSVPAQQPQPHSSFQPYESRQPTRQPSSRRQETQEFSVQVDQSRNDQTYIMKQQGNSGPGGGPIYDSSPSQPIPPAPPAPPLPGAARQVQAGSTTQPRLTRTNSGRVILQHVFRQ